MKTTQFWYYSCQISKSGMITHLGCFKRKKPSLELKCDDDACIVCVKSQLFHKKKLSYSFDSLEIHAQRSILPTANSFFHFHFRIFTQIHSMSMVSFCTNCLRINRGSTQEHYYCLLTSNLSANSI